ncbi:MAG TPA: hypothetical protein VI685_18195 [Candidatus Angelobacter sp.]
MSDSTPGTDNRLKSLFWPSVNTASDVDYLGTQGYWVCTVVALLSFIFSLIFNQEPIGLLYLIFYYFGGVGVRERSRYAAMAVAIMYSIETLVVVLTTDLRTLNIYLGARLVIHILLAALLLANVRATWIASNWNSASEEAAAPPRLNETWSDKFADQLPMWLWPRIKIFYDIYSVGFIMGVVFWIFRWG